MFLCFAIPPSHEHAVRFSVAMSPFRHFAMPKTNISLCLFNRKLSPYSQLAPGSMFDPRTQLCSSLPRNTRPTLSLACPPNKYPSVALLWSQQSAPAAVSFHCRLRPSAMYQRLHTVRCFWKQIWPQHEANRYSQCSTRVGNTLTITSTPLLHTTTRRDSSIHGKI